MTSLTQESVLRALDKQTLKVRRLPAKRAYKGESPMVSGYYPPTLELDDREVPSIKGFEVGKEVRLVVSGRVRHKSIEGAGKDQRTSVSVELREVGVFK